ncbi:HET-domain-containing protein, partial [Karstenula rhodostoma CBS 690.94]
RLIDVKEHRIVSGTFQDEYFALNYVWGGVKSLQATKENIGELEKSGAPLDRAAEIPASILDAMTFVAKMDVRYLWVDALCIVQNNAKEKHVQISLMHEIYAAAYATIVQHAGADANAGLPGVREGSRSLIAMKSQLGANILLAQASYATPKVLNTSIHRKRGWTLQEVLLSTRCLHFSNKHITFVCGSEWAEDWNFQDPNQETLGSIRSGLMRPISQSMWQMNPFSLLRAYDGGERKSETTLLSFESDILNAFQGLCGAITRLNGARFHFGIPSTCFDLALLWINFGPGTKRASHSWPSWSWVTWQG